MLGSIFMLIVLFIFTRMIKQTNIQKPSPVIYNQSRINEITNRQLAEKNIVKKTQSTVHFRKYNMIKVITIDDIAYWIENNALYQANTINRNILQETKKRVDTHSLDGVELDKIIFIVDRLTKGNDDSSNTGH